MRIAVDAMGGDHAPAHPVDGAVAAARNLGLGIDLVGREDLIRAELARHPDAADLDVRVIDAPDVIDMCESPAKALRKKPRASIRVAAEHVAAGHAAALFSAGHTGASVVAAHAAFGMLPGVDRPALAPTVPTRRGAAVLLDAGATVECKPQHLLQFAHMGAMYARVGLGVETPRIGLLSIGEEETKGNELTREAHQLLKASALAFIGNVEARGIFTGDADVVVCDGFTGNVALKLSEGLVEMVEDLLGEELQSTFSSQVGYLLSRRAFRRFRKRVDYSEFGGAPLLGVAGLCIVGHGRSSVKAVRNAVVMASRMADNQMMDRLRAKCSRSRCASRDRVRLPRTGRAGGRHGQGARRSVRDLREDVCRGRRGARRAAERPDLQRPDGSADAHRKHAAGDPDDERGGVPAAGRHGRQRRRSSPVTASANTRRMSRRARCSLPMRCGWFAIAGATCRKPFRSAPARWPRSLASMRPA